MHERASTRPPITISLLQLFALVMIAGAIFLNTAPYIDLRSNTPEPDKAASIAEVPPAPNKPSVRVVASAEMQSTKRESATTHARVQPPDQLPGFEDATTDESAPKNEKPLRAQAKALPLPHPAPKQGLAMLISTAPPLPVSVPKQARSARSDAPPLPTRAPKEVRTRIAGSALQQTGRASWYNLDSLTASGEKMDDAALTAAHRFLPFGTKVRIENIANGRSVVVRINDRGPFVAGRVIDVSKAAAKALDMMADGMTDVRLHVIYDTVASAGGPSAPPPID
jgi:rare lipoprotein A